MGDLEFREFWINIDHFRGVAGPLRGPGFARESKNGTKTGPKGGQKGSKTTILARFRPFFAVFFEHRDFGVLARIYVDHVCRRAFAREKKLVGILAYEDSKSGISDTV